MEAIEEMLAECQNMQDFLEVSTSDNMDELVDRLAEINVYMARSGKMLADANALRDAQVSEVFTQYSKMILKMPATISAKFISSQCVEVNRLCLWLDRINRACVHQSDNVRTLVSFGKEQLKMTRSGY